MGFPPFYQPTSNILVSVYHSSFWKGKDYMYGNCGCVLYIVFHVELEGVLANLGTRGSMRDAQV